MKIFSKKKKSNRAKNILVMLILGCAVLVYAFFNRQELHRLVVQVNGGSIYNDYLDAKFKLTEFFQNENNSKRKKLVVETSSSNYVKIQKERARKTKDFILLGGMIRTESTYYKAKIELDDAKSNSKVGLFGGASDNFRDANGFHFRIKYKGKEGFGEKMYNVLKPRSRGYNVDMLTNIIYESVFKGIGIDYEPVSVIFNKSNFGIYLTEEYFDKYLIESKSFRENVIFKTIAKDSIKFKHIPEVEGATLKTNLISDILENPDRNQLSELIDKDKMFGYFALCFLLNQTHASSKDNLHLFYNSVTHKLEPIVREFHLAGYTETPSLEDIRSKQQNAHFILDDWVRFIGVDTFESGIRKSLSKIKREMPNLLNLPEYVDYKHKLIGFKNDMKRNEDLILENLKKLDFLTTERQEHISQKTIIIQKDTVINQDFIIQKNEKLTINEGLSITFKDNSSLFVYGGIVVNGSKENPVYMNAEDSSSSIYINSSTASSLDYVFFKNLSALDRKLWQLPSAITVYESKLNFNNCSFESNQKGDDMINLFRCEKVTFNNCSFKNILSDAVDTDFSTIEINDSNFEFIGNDAVDGSGSTVSITNCYFSKVDDKVISAGEQSNFNSQSNTIANSELGLVCKDGSTLISKKDSLINNRIDLVMFIKKKYFKQPTMHLEETKINSNLIEKKVNITGMDMPKNISKGVKDKLYGNEFGKSSK